MKIKVTQEDIDKGIRHSPGSCPVARAINRQSEKDNASVGLSCIYFYNIGGFSETPTPLDAALFINKFDQRQPVKPFEFELEFPA